VDGMLKSDRGNRGEHTPLIGKLTHDYKKGESICKGKLWEKKTWGDDLRKGGNRGAIE